MSPWPCDSNHGFREESPKCLSSQNEKALQLEKAVRKTVSKRSDSENLQMERESLSVKESREDDSGSMVLFFFWLDGQEEPGKKILMWSNVQAEGVWEKQWPMISG